MDYKANLNDEQKNAVLTEAKHVRVIAGAGSGKTRVLTTRIVHLISERGFNPSRICAITFTNKAAQEMKDRMERMHPRASRVHISTIHALCVRIIREEYEALGLIRNFTILDVADQLTVLKEGYKMFAYDRKTLPPREVLSFISGNKFAGVGVAQADALAGNNERENMKVKLYEFYLQRLEALYALDFDDLLLKVNLLFKTYPMIMEKWQRRFDVVLVDEFQDVDRVQYSIIRALVGTDNDLYVVGDPDQTIYTWRGADVDFIVNFDEAFPNAETIILNQNYRSTQEILNRANALIENNKNRPPKSLFANKKSDEPVIYKQFEDLDSEANWIAQNIAALHHDGIPYSDIAILYRSNYQSRILDNKLSNHGIPFVIYGGLRFYDQQEIKDILSFIRMITHGDDLALRRSIATPRRGIGEKTLDKIAYEASQRQITMYQSMQMDVALGAATKKIKDYVELIESFKAIQANNSLEETARYVLEKSQLIQHYERLNESERVDSLKEFIVSVHEFEKMYPEMDLNDYMQMVTLQSERETEAQSDFVRLMTVHAAKGLEFNHVIIFGMIDNIFPSKRSVMDGVGGIEEERRLMYVAVTRAKDRLFITNNRDYNFVMGEYARPSRFIKEMKLDVPSESSALESSNGVLTKLEKVKPHTLRKGRFKPGDVIMHDEFGEGIVIRVDDDTYKIAFNFPHGTKVISNRFTGIHLKGAMS